MVEDNSEADSPRSVLSRRTVLQTVPAGALGLGALATGVASAETVVVEELSVPEGGEVTLELTLSASQSHSPDSCCRNLVITVAGDEVVSLDCTGTGGRGCTDSIEDETYQVDVSAYAGDTIEVAYEDPAAGTNGRASATVEDYEFDVNAPALDAELIVPNEIYVGEAVEFAVDVDYDGAERDLEFEWGYAATPVPGPGLHFGPPDSPTNEIEFSSAGRYAVQVNVRGTGDSFASAGETVTVGEPSLDAELVVPDELYVGEPVEFAVDVDYDGDESDLEYAWGHEKTPVVELVPGDPDSPTYEVEFSREGRYAVQVEVRGAGDSYASGGEIVTVEEPPTPDLDAELIVPDELYVGEPVEFAVDVDYDGAESDLEFEWGYAATPVPGPGLHFGPPDSPTNEIEFSSTGTYAVQVNVRGTGDSFASAGETVTVGERPLDVVIEAPDEIYAGQPVTFEADVEYGGDEGDLEFSWGHIEAADAPPQLVSTDDPTYEVLFPSSGSWAVHLDVAVDERVASADLIVDVATVEPTVHLDGPQKADVGETVEFEAEVEDCDDVSYAWTVTGPDDEADSYGHNFEVFPYEFDREGIHEVEVSVEGCDWSDSASATVDVADDDGPCPDAAARAEVDGRTVCDLNGDGNYRDVTASGDVTAQDLQMFFQNQHTEPWNERTDLFDFTGNGDVGQPDVVDLFHAI